MAIFEGAVTVYPQQLADELGDKAARILATIHYWQQQNKKKGQTYAQGRHWTYNSIREWSEKYFTSWSETTTKRILKKLRDIGLLITGCFNQHKYDRKLWYAVNHDKCVELFGYDPFVDDTEQKTNNCQNDKMYSAKKTETIAKKNTKTNNDDEFEKTIKEIKRLYGQERADQALTILEVYPEKTQKPVVNPVSMLKDAAIYIGRYLWMLEKPKTKAKKPPKAKVNRAADKKKKALIQSLYLS